MKKFFSLKMLALLFFIGACSPANSSLPTISAKYTDTEIDKMISDFHLLGNSDTYPTTELNNKFLADFPDARDVEWEKGTALFEVEFEIGRDDYKAYYDASGNLVMYEAEMSVKRLPALVKTTAQNKYPNFRLDDCKVIKKGTQTYYKVELENRTGNDVKLRIDEKGTILSENLDH